MHQPEMIIAEFHCHSCYSKDSLVTIQSLISTYQRKGIHRLVITDHNTIQGAILTHKRNPERFFIGEESMTQQGELLGIFVKARIPPGLPAVKTVELLRA